jgi:peptidoglycan/LPS O-acetylase OafA/YrhL
MQYRPDIDGLRAWAVLPVLFFHAGFDLFSGGFVGVDVFFVISGYLITTIIYTDMLNNCFSIITFYERRARRIIPALYVVLLFCLVPAYLFLFPSQLIEFSRSLISTPLFLSNFLFFTEAGYFQHTAELKPLLHTWSLSVEEQYYVIFPIFLLAFYRFGWRTLFTIVFIVFCFSLCLAQLGGNLNISRPFIDSELSFFNLPTWSFYLAPTRIWELAIGSICALSLIRKPLPTALKFSNILSLVGLCLLIFSFFYFDTQTPTPSIYTLIPTMGTALIILFSGENTVCKKILSFDGFVRIGLISYSLYLWHFPIFAFLKILYNPWELTIMAKFVGVLLSFLCGYLSWLYVEKGFRSKGYDNKFLISQKSIFTFTFTGAILFIFIGLIGIGYEGFKNRFSQQLISILNAREDLLSSLSKSKCFLKDEATVRRVTACTRGANVEPSIALWGDSYAAILASYLEKKLSIKNMSFIQYTKAACGPILGANYQLRNNSSKCAKYTNEVFDELLSSDVKTVIFSASWKSYIEGTSYKAVSNDGSGRLMPVPSKIDVQSADFENSIKLLISAGKKIIIIYPVPEVGWHVPETLAKRGVLFRELVVEKYYVTYSDFMKNNRESYTFLDKIKPNSHVIKIYPEKFLCNVVKENKCIVEINNTPLYGDSNHLSSEGVKIVVNAILPYLYQ